MDGDQRTEAGIEGGTDEAGTPGEQADADRAHVADRDPTSAEEEAADHALSEQGDDERQRVAEHYEEMTEIGAHVKGEGAIE
jgi:hypothetical protein